MCYSNSSTSSVELLAKKYRRNNPEIRENNVYHYVSGFSFPKLWTITKDPFVQSMQWGLIPYWYKGKQHDIASKTLNARIETLYEKSSFKHLIGQKHCIIPSNGFFEWQTNGKLKIPYFIYPKNSDELFSIAGLYDQWVDHETGEEICSFSIITTEANELMSKIHNTKKRMPLIIKAQKINEWLEGKTGDFSGFLIQNDEMKAHAIDKNLIKNHVNSIEITRPYEGGDFSQLNLFD